MNNLEWIKNNAKNFNLNGKDELCLIAYICKYKQACGINKTSCNECEFNNNLKNSLNCLLEEHKEPIKLKQWEYDFLKIRETDYGGLNRPLNENIYIKKLKNKGYFKNVDLNMTTEEVLTNCEIYVDTEGKNNEKH